MRKSCLEVNCPQLFAASKNPKRAMSGLFPESEDSEKDSKESKEEKEEKEDVKLRKKKNVKFKVKRSGTVDNAVKTFKGLRKKPQTQEEPEEEAPAEPAKKEKQSKFALKDLFEGISLSASSHNDYEKLQVMKAKTMYEMVEEIDVGHGPVKLLFLTNSQADSICSGVVTMKKMLEALEIDSPKLVINLIGSRGLRASLNLWPERKYGSESFAAMKHNAPPFLSLEQEQLASAKLDQFMMEVLLPLAASTQALILANAVPGDCALASSLTRSYRLQRAKWGNKPPFVILSVADNLPLLYMNRTSDAYWKALRRASKAWSGRDKAIQQAVENHGYLGIEAHEECPSLDLDKDARTFLLVDQVALHSLASLKRA